MKSTFDACVRLAAYTAIYVINYGFTPFEAVNIKRQLANTTFIGSPYDIFN